MDYSYIPITTRAILRAEYKISSDHEPPVFKIQKQFLYDITEIDVRFYHDPGYATASENITWLDHFQIDQSIQIDNKTLHQGIATIDSYITITLSPEVITDDPSSPYLYSIVIVMIIVLITGILLYRRNASASPEEKKKEEASPGSEEEGPISESEEDDLAKTTDKVELTLQKDKMLLAMKALDEDLEKGKVSQEAYDELKANYKAETINIMKDAYNNLTAYNSVTDEKN